VNDSNDQWQVATSACVDVLNII